jgi:nucleoside-diphosphate-sugar epimerase
LGESSRRVVVVGARSPLGRAVLDRLHKESDFVSARGVETHAARRNASEADIDIVPFHSDHRTFLEYLAREEPDTVIQCGVTPDRIGLAGTGGEADVIGAMRLGAAIGSPGASVRNWVLASSTSIYPITSGSPFICGEDSALSVGLDATIDSIHEAEDYARDLARRAPHINVSILRLQHLIGRSVNGGLASLLRERSIPSPIGFDSSIQLLHIEDAAQALVFAAGAELAGVYNVASAGFIPWSRAIERIDRRSIPVLPLGTGPIEGVLRRLGIPHIPASLSNLLRYGHVVDTAKIERAGWKPLHDQSSCLLDLS